MIYFAQFLTIFDMMLDFSSYFRIFSSEMQQIKREEVSEYLVANKHSIKQISVRCGVSLKSVCNVRAKLQCGEKLDHKKGAGRPMKLTESDRISLGIKLRNQPRISLRTLKSQFKLERGWMYHMRAYGGLRKS